MSAVIGHVKKGPVQRPTKITTVKNAVLFFGAAQPARENEEEENLSKVALAADLVVLLPGLTRADAELLAACPYDLPSHINKQDARRASRMRRAGLLEVDWSPQRVTPAGKLPHRCTELGEEVVLALRQKGWLPWPRKP